MEINNPNSVSAYGSSAVLPPVVGKQPDDKQTGHTPTTTATAPAVTQQTAVNAKQDNVGNNTENKAAEKQQDENGKAYFAVDADKNVVIKVTDASGKVVKQIPAEDYLQAVKVLDENAKDLLQSSVGSNLYHKEA
ncbi:MAG: flagellar protein FlaG [Candidatus Magnetominusculus sp. LBB02]|nr:flagellar protein FlaG [Candidatus Magnetominusculus sp. LBB02]